MTSKMRRASLETIERIVKDVTVSEAEATRDRRLSLTMMNCIWARHTDTETREPVQGEASGTIPTWLRGTLYRVGPGIIQVGDSCFNHPFDMLSVVHRYAINLDAPGSFLYSNKIIDSKTREHAVSGNAGFNNGSGSSAGGLLSVMDPGSGNGSPDPFKSKLQRFTALFQKPKPSGVLDNCIDNFCFFDKDLYIMSDISHMLKIQPDTLDTLAQCNVEEYVPVKLMTSHPQIDDQGTVWNIGTAFESKKGYAYTILKFEKTIPDWSGTMIIENATVVGSIPARHKSSPSYYHSFGMTQDFIVFVEQPLYVDEVDRNGFGTPLVHNNLKWKKTEMVNIYLFNKTTNELHPVTYSCEPFFFFHIINAFQDKANQYVFIDIIAYKDAEILSDLKFSHIERTDHVPAAKPIRIKLPLQTAMVSCNKVVVRKEALTQDAHLEFPRINYRVAAGKSYKYFYALGNEYLHPNRILKIDVTSGDVTSWKEPGFFVSEPLFIPKPTKSRESDEAEEDDGVLVFTLLSPATLTHVQLVILDAKTLTEFGRISFRANGTVTEGFHGIFVVDDDPKNFTY